MVHIMDGWSKYITLNTFQKCKRSISNFSRCGLISTLRISKTWEFTGLKNLLFLLWMPMWVHNNCSHIFWYSILNLSYQIIKVFGSINLWFTILCGSIVLVFVYYKPKEKMGPVFHICFLKYDSEVFQYSS